MLAGPRRKPLTGSYINSMPSQVPGPQLSSCRATGHQQAESKPVMQPISCNKAAMLGQVQRLDLQRPSGTSEPSSRGCSAAMDERQPRAGSGASSGGLRWEIPAAEQKCPPQDAASGACGAPSHSPLPPTAIPVSASRQPEVPELLTPPAPAAVVHISSRPEALRHPPSGTASLLLVNFLLPATCAALQALLSNLWLCRRVCGLKSYPS